METKVEPCKHNWIVKSGSRANRRVDVFCNYCQAEGTLKNPTPDEMQTGEGAKSHNFVLDKSKHKRVRIIGEEPKKKAPVKKAVKGKK